MKSVQIKKYVKADGNPYIESKSAIVRVNENGTVDATIIECMYNTKEWKQGLVNNYGHKRELDRLLKLGWYSHLPKGADAFSTQTFKKKDLTDGQTCLTYRNIAQAVADLKNQDVVFMFVHNNYGFDCQSIRNGSATFRIRSRKEIYEWRLKQRKAQ